ncbi:MAG: LysM peptidoglycan-binding domain-containing protein [Planctomycetes bacterium]|nr:LysM peptidoglycan-binding domain-containing protein [Planctomycetota bacterium]
MRTDVKVGIALGAIVLIVAGAYYGANKDPDIQLAGADDDVREQNKRTLRDLLAPPPHTPTTSPNHARSTTASPPSDTTPHAPARVFDRSASEAPSKPIAQARRRDPNLTRPASSDSEKPSSASLPTINANTTPAFPSTETAPLIPKPIGRRAERSDPPATSSRPRKPVQSPDPMKGRRTPEQSSKSTPRKIPKPITRTRTHVVAPEDNFSTLAQRYYGSQSYAGLLVQANPNVDPRRMKIGSRITIPPLNPEDARPPAQSEAREVGTRRYYVQEGDSLYAIADAKLGTGARWSEIYELNKAVIGADPSRLKVGVALTLPAY